MFIYVTLGSLSCIMCCSKRALDAQIRDKYDIRLKPFKGTNRTTRVDPRDNFHYQLMQVLIPERNLNEFIKYGLKFKCVIFCSLIKYKTHAVQRIGIKG